MSVDGGLLDNYPIAIFDQQKYLPNKSLDYNPETLGIFPTSESGAESDPQQKILLVQGKNPSKVLTGQSSPPDNVI